MKTTILGVLAYILCTSALLAQDIKVVNLPTNDLIYAPSQDKIYVTTPSTSAGGSPYGNRLCIVDPYFGRVEQCFFVGSEPHKLAISDDEAFLYIGLDGAPEVVKFNLSTKAIESTFSLGSDPFFGPLYAEDIEVLPGAPHSVVVARRNVGVSPRHEGVAIYDNGVQRPNTTQDHTGSNSITFAESNAQLYGYNNETTEFGFRRILINPNGLAEGTVTPNLIGGFDRVIESQGNRIYANNGQVVRVDGPTPTLVGSFSIPFHLRTAVEPAPDSSVVYFITSDFSGQFNLETFDKTTYNNIQSLGLPTFNGLLGSLINWGTGGKLAFNTTESLVILRNCTSLISSAPVLSPTQVGGCSGEFVTLTAPAGYDNYYWSNGSTDQSISVNTGGLYFFSAMDSLGCLSAPSNPTTVQFDATPTAPFIAENAQINLCQGQSVTLSSTSFWPSYLWSNGGTNQSIQVFSSGMYSVAGVSANGCVGPPSNPITVTVLNTPAPAQPTINIVGTTIFCEGESVLLLAPPEFESYLWSDGQTTRTIEVFTSGSYSVQVGNAADCISLPSQTIFIQVIPIPAQPQIIANGNVLASTAPTGNQWFLNGNPIPGATQQFYLASSNGFYTVQVTILTCSSPMSELYSHTLVGLEDDLTNAQRILVYPNPVTDALQLQLSTDAGARMPVVELFDLTGRMLQRYTDTNQILLAHLPQGPYFIRILARDGSLLATQFISKI